MCGMRRSGHPLLAALLRSLPKLAATTLLALVAAATTHAEELALDDDGTGVLITTLGCEFPDMPVLVEWRAVGGGQLVVWDPLHEENGLPDRDELWAVDDDGAYRFLGQRVDPGGEPKVIASRMPNRLRVTALVAYGGWGAVGGGAVTFHCANGEIERTTDRLGVAEVDNCIVHAVEVKRQGFLPLLHQVENAGENHFQLEPAVDLAAPDPHLFPRHDGRVYENGDAMPVVESEADVLGDREEGRDDTAFVVLDQRDLEPIAGAEVILHCEEGVFTLRTDRRGEATAAECRQPLGFEVAKNGFRAIRYALYWDEEEDNLFEVALVRRERKLKRSFFGGR